MNDYTIEQNKDIALVKLNNTWQIPDKLCIIKYYTETGGIDFLLAIGKASGFGPNCYSIVQAHEETLVLNISNRLSDVSTLSHSEKVLCYCDPNNNGTKWYMITDEPDGDILVRHFTELTKPWIYRNLDDGFRWFFRNGVLRREDDFLSSQETIELVEQNIEYFQPPKIVLDFDFPEDTVVGDNYNYYLPDLDPVVIEKPTFTVRIYNYKNQDVTEEYSISLDGPEELTYSDGRYTVWGRYEEDFTINLQATKNALTTTVNVNVWFPDIIYYGTSVISEVDQSIVLRNIKTKYIYHDLKNLDLLYTLNNERAILIIPKSYTRFQHIYDRNGLDYVQNYEYILEYEYLGTIYLAYLKKEPVIITNFQQRFTYSEEYIDIPNSGWLRELDKEDYYTKEQINEIIAAIPTFRIDGNKLTIGERSFRLEPWIDVADYYIGMIGGTRNMIYSKTAEQLIENATPYMVQSNPDFVYTYTTDDSELNILYIILRSGMISLNSGSLKSGGLVTTYTQSDFTNPTYFDIQYGTVSINNIAYKIFGVRGISLCDAGNIITLNFIKH